MSKYQAIFFPDPYDIGIRDVIIKEDLVDLLGDAVKYYKEHMNCPVLFQELQGKKWKNMTRSVYRDFNQRMGRF